MRSLFVKIFIWFWLTMALANVAFFVSGELTRPQPFSPPFREVSTNIFGMYAQTAVDTFEKSGPDALAGFIDRMEQTTHVRSALFNSDGDKIFGDDTIRGAKELAQQALQNQSRDTIVVPGRPRIVAKAITGATGTRYVMVIDPPASPFDTGSKLQTLRLLAFLLTAGVLCYLLAKYLTSPVAKLSAMTHKLASGDLSARMGPVLGRRHDELADLGRDFDVMAERIESLIVAQRRLLGDISHELRSPLSRLSVALGLARHKAGLQAKTELDRIEHEADIINELIGQMLTLTRLESKTEGIRIVEFDLAGLLRNIVDDADFEACEKQCRVSISSIDDCRIKGSLELIHSAIENVLRNAVQYTPAGTDVEVSLKCVGVAGRNWATITVRDHGPGVPNEALDSIFKPFYRVADARDRASGGTGLGLAITARAFRLHGGSVIATNAPGGGLLLTLSLPLADLPLPVPERALEGSLAGS